MAAVAESHTRYPPVTTDNRCGDTRVSCIAIPLTTKPPCSSSSAMIMIDKDRRRGRGRGRRGAGGEITTGVIRSPLFLWSMGVMVSITMAARRQTTVPIPCISVRLLLIIASAFVLWRDKQPSFSLGPSSLESLQQSLESFEKQNHFVQPPLNNVPALVLDHDATTNIQTPPFNSSSLSTAQGTTKSTTTSATTPNIIIGSHKHRDSNHHASSSTATTTSTRRRNAQQQQLLDLLMPFELPSNVTYPLQELNLESAREAYERGFWQIADPVPLNRWQAIANTTCIPHNSTAMSDWKRKVPHVIMIGAQKGGTTALSYYLYNHPSVPYFPAKELQFFDVNLDQNSALLVNGSGIDATKVLNVYQETLIANMVPLDRFQSEKAMYALDATPNYLWLSDRVPHRILCVAPWTKLLAVLRNPVDRAFSQYHMQLNHDRCNPDRRRGFVSFDDYIDLDIKVLQETGVLPQDQDWWSNDNNNSNQQRFSSLDNSWLLSDQTTQAWATYTKLGLNSPVGRGLYALQLRQWIQVMDLYNKPRSDLKVISSQRLHEYPNETYTEVLQFLELPSHALEKYRKIHATNYQNVTMSSSTRRKLQAFYEPFNRLLVDVLSSLSSSSSSSPLHSADEWDQLWESHPER